MDPVAGAATSILDVFEKGMKPMPESNRPDRFCGAVPDRSDNGLCASLGAQYTPKAGTPELSSEGSAELGCGPKVAPHLKYGRVAV